MLALGMGLGILPDSALAGNPSGNDSMVTQVRLNTDSATISVGAGERQTYQLTATVAPESAHDRTLAWTSSDTSVAKVDGNGLVTSVAPGTATITATARDGSKEYASCRVTVKVAPYAFVRQADKIDPNKPMIALTFDDGPRAATTSAILDTLERYNAHATFFVLGQSVDGNEDIIRRAQSLGCEIASHSFRHAKLASLSVTALEEDLSAARMKIASVTGKTPALMRPPYGTVTSRIISAAGAPIILWSVDTRDWEHRSARKIIRITLRKARDGAIVLMHDIHRPTAIANETLIPELIQRGFQLVTVSELAYYKGVRLEAGRAYRSMKP